LILCNLSFISARKLNCVSRNGSSASTWSPIDTINFECFGTNFGTANWKCRSDNLMSTPGLSMTDATAKDPQSHWSVSDFRWRNETGQPTACKTAEPAYKAIPWQWTISSDWFACTSGTHSVTVAPFIQQHTTGHEPVSITPRLEFTNLTSPKALQIPL
jgi:hypothetical protein